MKKILIVITLICSILVSTSCSKKCEYDQKISQLRLDVLIGETEDIKVICYPEQRESLYEADGKCSALESTLIFKLYFKNPDKGSEACAVKFSLNGKDYSGNFEYSPLSTNLHCSLKADSLPSNSLAVTLESEKICQTVHLKSVRNQNTLSYSEAIEHLKNNDPTGTDMLVGENTEIRIRLIDNGGKDYWYIGLVSPEKDVSYLLDGESGEIVAKKDDL